MTECIDHASIIEALHTVNAGIFRADGACQDISSICGLVMDRNSDAYRDVESVIAEARADLEILNRRARDVLLRSIEAMGVAAPTDADPVEPMLMMIRVLIY